MGLYINKGSYGFERALNSEYVDKTLLIHHINQTLDTERAFSCVTRCRRFGKSMAARMLCAYYDESCDSRPLFANLKITSLPEWDKYLNKFPVIYVDITDFTTRYRKDEQIVEHIKNSIQKELLQVYPQVQHDDEDDLMVTCFKVVEHTHKRFVMIIDEWDAVLREYDQNKSVKDDYVDLLRRLFKGSASMDVFAGVYMTGILPIKKHQTESALNNFREYSMIEPGDMAPFYGFTPTEVQSLADKHNVEVEELKKWYDGYKIGDEYSIYNPYSVMESLHRKRCKSYWATTGAYDSVRTYIQLNFEGLKDDIINMLGGGRCDVRTSTFQNDMSIIRSKDDVLTVLIHLGYLAFDDEYDMCYIPNKEVADEMETAVKETSWKPVIDALTKSKLLLETTLSRDAEAVAQMIELVHDDTTSILSYNNENSLACALSIAYYYARNSYIIHREYASGKGYADLVLMPRRGVELPAMVIELKYNHTAASAIAQIKQKIYPAKVAEYTGQLLLVGICYDKQTKQHSCAIEEWNKE